jgi:ketosteroid isomerase-like protein
VSIDENKQVARAYIESFADQTGEATLALLAESARVRIMIRSAGTGLPEGMTKSEYRVFRQQERPKFLPNGVRHEVRSMICEGDIVTAETECFADLPGGGVYNNVFHFAFEIRDGLVQASREYTDILYAKVTLSLG